MSNSSAYPADDPRRLLSSTRDLTRRVRKTQRATWFPLLVFAAVTFAAIPAYYSGHSMGTCVATGPGRVCSFAYTAGFVYWPIALMLAYVGIAAFYVRRSRARGVGTRIRPYVVVGIVLAFAVTAISLWAFHHPSASPHGLLGPASVTGRLDSPGCAVGLALLVLAWAERNRALAVFTLGYLVFVVGRVSFGWAPHDPVWAFLPRLVIDGSILLLGGFGFMLADQSGQSAAP
jgi:hypothetical protein